MDNTYLRRVALVALGTTVVGIILFSTTAFAGHGHAQTLPKKRLDELMLAAEHGDGKALAQLKEHADHGDIDAELTLGEVYYHGIRPASAPFELVELHYSHFLPGTVRDYDEAMQWFRKAAEQGSPVGEERVGSMYLHGKGVFVNKDEALAWLFKAANHGDIDAAVELGDRYTRGDIVTDLDAIDRESERWWRKAADAGNASAQASLGKRYFYRKKNYSEAHAWYLKAAEQGNADAQSQLGKMHETGLGVEQDKTRAYAWYLIAAASENGVIHTDDCDRLAKQLTAEDKVAGRKWAVEWSSQHLPANVDIRSASRRYYGMDLRSDFSEPMRTLLKDALKGDKDTFAKLVSLAESGNVEAELELGGLYAGGLTNYPIVWAVDRDTAEAYKWYFTAAQQGNTQASYLLGKLYASGGIKDEHSEAMKWFRKAAEAGYPEAIRMIGGRYEFGVGVRQNFKEAAIWYRKAADRGEAFAQISLSKFYEIGLGGLERSYIDAYFWQLVAAVKLDPGNVSLSIDEMPPLSSEQKAEAWARMKNWRPVQNAPN